MKRKPLKQAEFIKEEFAKYIKSTFVLKDPKYRDFFHKELDQAVLTQGPYLKMDLPFYKGRTINQLINDNEASPLFREFQSIKLDRSLYWHQEEALKLISQNESIVVTTGTGSGKTEAFLYPIINELLKKIEKNGNLEGIQVLLLYPMNALVNDQLERLRELLQDFPEIVFGYFTGDTKHDYNRYGGNREGYIKKYFSDRDIKPPANEMLVKSEIREKPPHILITNYSMLEYLLVRPKDKKIFNKETLKDWSFMVLDEAHTYKGTLATEISFLLKRLQHFSGKKPQFILTSATLGSKEEDKSEIVRFAKDLTSANFKEKGVIFAKRIPMNTYKIKYALKPKEYELLLTLEKESLNYINILKKYSSETIFDLLKNDSNIHLLSRVLNVTRTFDETYKRFANENEDFSPEDLENLIEIVTSKNVRDKDNTGLYDIKYHLFVRTLQGAFISLDPKPKLEITNREKIDDMWAFEIGSCKNCNTMYITGKVSDSEKKLFRSELELDENYENYENLKVDFFLVKSDVINEIEDISKGLEEALVCSKCGHYYSKEQVDPEDCECGLEYKVELLKVTTNNNIRSNLTQCSVCNNRSNKWGIIDSFSIGKDQATALLSQMLLQSMDMESPEKEIVYDIFGPKDTGKDQEIENYKQFLAFSDSRQQASFYALFLQNNLDKFLRKALLLKHCDKKDINIVINSIEHEIETNDLFHDEKSKNLEMKSISHAAVTVLLDLFKADGVNSLEGLGLIVFKPKLDKIIKHVSKDDLKQHLPKVKIEDLEDLLCTVLEIFRTTPAIHTNLLNVNQREEYLNYRMYQNYVTLQKSPGSKETHIRSLLPVRVNDHNFLTNFIARAYGLSLEESKSYIEIMWRILVGHKIIVSDDNVNYYLKLEQFQVFKGEHINWYVCDQCKTMTHRNINNTCFKKDCRGTLEQCDPKEINSENYYYQQYLKKKIEKIVVEEHTGQIDNEKASRFQIQFKNKELNVLSSSTTFEMGVDIGSLSTVFMRNIPPTNANYSQRAGRAGRSDNSVGFIVTYVNNNSHDQIFFNNPTPMIDGVVSPPVFKLDNKKIISRHIMAFILSLFYREFDYRDDVKFFIEEGYKLLYNYLENNKLEIEKNINALLDDSFKKDFIDYKWYEELLGEDSLIEKFLANVKKDYNDLLLAKAILKEEENYRMLQSLKKEIKLFLEKNIVEAFSKYNTIPSYGFPINVVPLKIFDKVKNAFNKTIDITRDLSIAISEYAPDSEIIVNKEKYKSEYIALPDEGGLIDHVFIQCENQLCGYNEVLKVTTSYDKCPKCGDLIKATKFIEPIYGFISTGTRQKSGILKPAKSFASEIIYLGDIDDKINEVEYLPFKDVLKLNRTIDDKLLLLNENPFFYCETCGYAELNRDKAGVPFYYENKTHKTHYGRDCPNKKFLSTAIGHIMITDVIKIRMKLKMDFEEAYSTLTALKNGITSYLQIDRFDINGTVVKDGESYAFILYDTTYGGSGNVSQLFKRDTLLKAFNLSLESVNKECCSEEVSCENCLRDYYNKNNHTDLVRGKARDTIKTIINKLNN